jgi:hypothetical protein
VKIFKDDAMKKIAVYKWLNIFLIGKNVTDNNRSNQLLTTTKLKETLKKLVKLYILISD